MLTLEGLAARFRGPAKRDAKGLTVFCPAHADGRTQNRPSLRLTETPATGGLHVRCWAGCAEDAVLTAVGLTLAELVPARIVHDARGGPRLVATYPYHDEAGALLYEVCRYEPKDFRQRRPDGAGGWHWNMTDVRRVPYRLPELAGIACVFIPEGEKDVDALRTLGLVATCNVGGAGKWTAADTAALVAVGVQTVAILPDHDDAGAAHATKVAASCHGAGLTARIVPLPGLSAKEDVSDWLAGGHTASALAALVSATAAFAPPTPAGPAPTDDAPDSNPEAEHLTDAGNARHFAREHGADVRYCYAWRAWLVWDGRRWARDPGDQMVQRAKETARQRLRDAAAIPEESARKAAVRHALYSESARGLQAMVALAQSEAGIPIAAETLDAHDFLLNTPSGTVELGPTPRLRPARREDYLTKLTAVPYVPEARHPMWDRFLSDMLPDAETRAYVQRAAGYSCTGSQAEEVLFLIRGRTAAGKTTLQEALKSALGDYALAADFETFTVRKDAHGPREDLVRLKGARIVTTSETRARRLDEGMVKRVTGGDTLAGRRLYENTEEFRGTFKLWLAGNERPVVGGDDDAIWRRIREIPFPRSLAAGERDPVVKATLTDPLGAGPAVLAWAVAGCAAWCQRRDAGQPALGEPAAVVEATADYRGVMDTVAAFLDAACVLEADAWISREDLRAALDRWGREEGVSDRMLPSATALARGLRERGALSKGRKGCRGWAGVRLRGPGDPEPAAQDEPAAETMPAW
jgi:putative DNA primase/helicase